MARFPSRLFSIHSAALEGIPAKDIKPMLAAIQAFSTLVTAKENEAKAEPHKKDRIWKITRLRILHRMYHFCKSGKIDLLLNGDPAEATEAEYWVPHSASTAFATGASASIHSGRGRTNRPNPGPKKRPFPSTSRDGGERKICAYHTHLERPHDHPTHECGLLKKLPAAEQAKFLEGGSTKKN